MKYFVENDTVAVMEANASFFRVYHADSMQLRRQYDIKVSNGVGEQRSAVVLHLVPRASLCCLTPRRRRRQEFHSRIFIL